jgi:sulfite exporter TauE/SafE
MPQHDALHRMPHIIFSTALLYSALTTHCSTHCSTSPLLSSAARQILGFSAIINFGFHRILRPANRLDPLRSILEVEIIGICWDALDGATLYQLLASAASLSLPMHTAVRLLMFFWYLSVGCRLAMMFCSHLTPASRIYQVQIERLCLSIH